MPGIPRSTGKTNSRGVGRGHTLAPGDLREHTGDLCMFTGENTGSEKRWSKALTSTISTAGKSQINAYLVKWRQARPIRKEAKGEGGLTMGRGVTEGGM